MAALHPTPVRPADQQFWPCRHQDDQGGLPEIGAQTRQQIQRIVICEMAIVDDVEHGMLARILFEKTAQHRARQLGLLLGPHGQRLYEEALKDTTICQPAMVATDIAIMRMLSKHGVFPDMVMGHSLGEWAAAVGARMLNFSEALVAVSARARAMASVSIGDKGKMASVLGPTDEIVRRLPEIGGYLTPANMNSKKQTVIAGASDAVDRAERKSVV